MCVCALEWGECRLLFKPRGKKMSNLHLSKGRRVPLEGGSLGVKKKGQQGKCKAFSGGKIPGVRGSPPPPEEGNGAACLLNILYCCQSMRILQPSLKLSPILILRFRVDYFYYACSEIMFSPKMRWLKFWALRCNSPKAVGSRIELFSSSFFLKPVTPERKWNKMFWKNHVE